MSHRNWLKHLFGLAPKTSDSCGPRGSLLAGGGRRRLGLEALEDRLAPATLAVNSSADTASGSDAYLSLREAIAIVNSPTLPSGLSDQILGQISGTLHGGGTDSIVFDHSQVSAPITLGGTQLELSLPGSTASLTIDGGSGITVDGNNASRVLQVDGGARDTLDHLTITHGTISSSPGQGGGILNSGMLTVINSTLFSNSTTYGTGGGIDNTYSGTLTVSNSNLSSNSAGAGGGIYNESGTVTVNNSTLSSNSADAGGGGILNDFSGTLTVSNSTLSSNSAGTSGGGIFNDYGSTLTVSNSTLSSNSATYYGGGIDNNSGTVTVSNSTLSANSAINGTGGGINNNDTGTMTVSNSTLSANSAPIGGGIYNSATYSRTLTVSNSTLSGNSAALYGGGIYNYGGTLMVSNSILASNSASSGGAITNVGYHTLGDFYGILNITNSTLESNSAAAGGGISNGISLTSLSLRSTIVAGNSGTDISGPVLSTSSYNLVGIGNGLSGISNGIDHNQIGTTANPIDPLLAPLGYQGGPTRTSALLPGSPALDAGDPSSAATTDQRGLPRVVNGRSDIGAFQTQANPFLVTTLQDPGHLSGLLSLREAVNLANVLPGSNTVSFDPNLGTGTLTLSAGELLLSHDITIVGPSAGPLTVSGNNASRVFEVAAGTTVNLSNLTVANGQVSSASLAQGGGILNAGNLTLTDCAVTNNQTTVSLTGTGTENVFAQGGGICTTGPLTLVRCTLSGNSATLSAGNVSYANANGGGLYANGTMVTLSNCTVAGNSANATFTGGTGLVFAYGGGLTSDFGTLTLTDCTVSGNSVTGGNASGEGGGVHSYTATVSLSNCTIINNTANSSGDVGLGGGVSGLDSSLSLTSCTMSGNSATSMTSTGSGGGIYLGGVATASVLNTIVAGNNSLTDSPDASGTFASQGSNLIGITDGSAGWCGSDLTGTTASPLDPLLAPLGNYGGLTATAALLGGSSALDAGDPAQLGSADQRGVVRSGGVNIGAFQASAATLVVSAPGSVTAGAAFDVTVSAFDVFNQPAVGYTGTITFSSGDPSGASLPPDYAFTLADGGAHTFAGQTILYTPGTWDVTVTDLTNGLTGSANVNVSAGAAPGFTPPGGGRVGVPVTPVGTDAFDNGASRYQGEAALAHGDGGVARYPIRATDSGQPTAPMPLPDPGAISFFLLEHDNERLGG